MNSLTFKDGLITNGKWFVSMQGVDSRTGERIVRIGFEGGVELGNAVYDKRLIENAPQMFKMMTGLISCLMAKLAEGDNDYPSLLLVTQAMRLMSEIMGEDRSEGMEAVEAILQLLSRGSI